MMQFRCDLNQFHLIWEKKLLFYMYYEKHSPDSKMIYTISLMLILSNFYGIQVSSQFVSSEKDNLTSFIVRFISNHHPKENKHTIVIYGNFSSQFFKSIFSLNIDIVTFNSEKKRPNDFTIELPAHYQENYIQYSASIFIFNVKTIEELSEGIFRLSNTIYWSTYSKFIVYMENKSNLAMSFFLFWLHNIQYCIIVIFHENRNILIYDFNPYVSQIDNFNENQYNCWSSKDLYDNRNANVLLYLNCMKYCTNSNQKNILNTSFYSTCIEINYKPYHDESNYFHDKTINMNSFNIKILATALPQKFSIETNYMGQKKLGGKHGSFIHVILQKMNLTFTLIEKNISKIKEWVDCYVNLTRKKIDMIGNPIIPTYLIPHKSLRFDLSHFVEESGVCFVVRRPGIIPIWGNLRYIYDTSGLILTIIVFCLTMCVFFIYLTFKKKNLSENLIYSWICTIQFFLSQPVNWINDAKSLRVYIFIIYWFVFIVNLIFLGTIVAMTTIPKYDKFINTLEDLYNSGYSVEGFSEMNVAFPSTSPVYVALKKRFVKIENIYGCIDDLQNGSLKACWVECATAHLFSIVKKDCNRNSFIHVGQEKLLNNHLVFILYQNSPLKKRIDHYIARIIESGLPNKWKKIFTFERSSGDLKRLQLQDIELHIFILLFGLIISCISFIIEIFSSFLRKYISTC